MKPDMPQSSDNLLTSHISPAVVQFGQYKGRAIAGRIPGKAGHVPAFALYDLSHPDQLEPEAVPPNPITVIGGNEPVENIQTAIAIGKQMLIHHFNPLVINAQVLASMLPGDRLFIGRADLHPAKRFNQHLDLATVVKAATSTSNPVIQLSDRTHTITPSGHLEGDHQHLMALAIDLGPATDFLSAITRLVTTRAWLEPRSTLEVGDRVVFTSEPSPIGDFQLGLAEVTGLTAFSYQFQVLSNCAGHPETFESRFSGAIDQGPLKGGAVIGVCLRRFAPSEWPLELATANEQLAAGEPFHSLSELTPSGLFQPSRPLFNQHPQAVAALTELDRVIVDGKQFAVASKSDQGLELVSHLNQLTIFTDLEGVATDGTGRFIEAVLQGERVSSTLEGVEYDFKTAKEAGKLICQPVIDTTLDAILEVRPGDQIVMQYAETGRLVNASVIMGYDEGSQVATIHVEGQNRVLASATGLTERGDGLFFAGKVNHLPFAGDAASTLAKLDYEDDKQQLAYRAAMVDMLLQANADMHGNIRIKAPGDSTETENSGLTISLLRQELAFFDMDYRWAGSELPLHSHDAVNALLSVAPHSHAVHRLSNYIAQQLDQQTPPQKPAASIGMRL